MLRSERLEFLTLTSEQASCLVSALRQELMSAFISFGPAPIDEIARRIGRRPTSLYYHVDLLERTGLLRRTGSQVAGKRPETIYDSICERLRFDTDRVPESEDMVRQSMLSMIRASEREFNKAALQGSESGTGPSAFKTNPRLSPEDRAEFQRRLLELIEWAKKRDDPGYPRVGLTHIIVPLSGPHSVG